MNQPPHPNPACAPTLVLLFAISAKLGPLVFSQMIKIHALEIISLRWAQMIQIYALEIISQITSVELGKEDSQTQIVPSTFCQNLGCRICSKRSSLLNLKKRQICHSSLNMHRIILSKKVQWNESSQDTSGASSHGLKMNFSKILQSK